MGYTNFISEAEAINHCGVSAKTLARFAEAGYLSVEKESDGLRLYSTEELEKVFGNPVIPSRSDATRHKQVAPESNSLEGQTSKTASNSSLAAQIQKEEEGEYVQRNYFSNSSIETSLSEPSSPAAAPETSANEESEDGASSAEAETYSQFVQTIPPKKETVEKVEPLAPSEELSTVKSSEESPKLLSLLESERGETARLRLQVEKLERINEVNEKIIELREERISELFDEKKWLRERVEHLEDKADRDQVLLLSETQLLKQLLIQNSQKSSPIRSALEWIGLVEPRQPNFPVGKTIEGSSE